MPMAATRASGSISMNWATTVPVLLCAPARPAASTIVSATARSAALRAALI